jgi:hypothetical protein
MSTAHAVPAHPRTPEAFQQPVGWEEFQAICHLTFGKHATVLSATELGTGMYTMTYRVSVDSQKWRMILWIAPESDRQFSSERVLMHNE